MEATTNPDGLTDGMIRGGYDPDRQQMVLRDQTECSLAGLMVQGLRLAAIMTLDSGGQTIVTVRSGDQNAQRQQRFEKIMAQALRGAFAVARAEGLLEPVKSVETADA